MEKWNVSWIPMPDLTGRSERRAIYLLRNALLGNVIHCKAMHTEARQKTSLHDLVHWIHWL